MTLWLSWGGFVIGTIELLKVLAGFAPDWVCFGTEGWPFP